MSVSAVDRAALVVLLTASSSASFPRTRHDPSEALSTLSQDRGPRTT